MNDPEGRKEMKNNGGISRREFLKYTGVAVVGAGLGHFMISDGMAAIPVSGGYLLVDSKKCQGCVTCMLACSLVHEGYESLSLARIQIVQNSFEKWPYDIIISQCRQCETPACLTACPVEAVHADPNNGNVRVTDDKKCIAYKEGCQSCIRSCSYTPRRPVFNVEGKYAQKCDLCINTPFWKEQGGVNGKQACVEMCPLNAIKFTTQMPDQEGDAGYNVNLRDRNWSYLGYPTY